MLLISTFVNCMVRHSVITDRETWGFFFVGGEGATFILTFKDLQLPGYSFPQNQN